MSFVWDEGFKDLTSLQLVLVQVRDAVGAPKDLLHLIRLLHHVGEVVLHVLNLVDVHLAVLALHLLHAQLHGRHRRLRVLEHLGAEVGLLHVEGLLLKVAALVLVHLPLLENVQRLRLDGVLFGMNKNWLDAIHLEITTSSFSSSTLAGPSRIFFIWSLYLTRSASRRAIFLSIESARLST